MTSVDCVWAPADARPSVSVSVSIFPNGFAPTGDGAGNARHFYDELSADADEDAADPTHHVAVGEKSSSGFTAASGSAGSVTRTVVADNAVVTVIVRDRDTPSEDLDRLAADLLRRIAPDAATLADQVVAALR
ncbi:hypothetical protein AB0M20_12885 [Actinoplanes sp. NPDC051633]|uniref:hypothetical protein n=1 Tax=Actinoplanes sp. NPDC051633 TaxID=3155670 RepID=UPI0034237587